MKKIISVILACCFALCAFALTGCAGGDTENLVVYNTADYIELSVLDDFEEYYYETTGKKVHVIYSTYDTNETLLSKFMNGDANVDLFCASDYALQKLMTLGYLEALNPSTDSENFEYYENIDGDIISKIDETFGAVQANDGNVLNMNDYFVPYMWGTLGILYNEAKVSEEELEENGWGILWNTQQNPEITGKILMKDSIRDAYAVAVGYAKQQGLLPEKYADYTTEQLINETEKDMRDIVERVLKEERSELQGYEVDFGKEDMIKERAYICLAWSGDALWAMEDSPEDVSLAYYFPEDCVNVWFDGWGIPKAAKNKDAAKAFVNYLCRTDIAMRNSMEIGYTCGVSEQAFRDSEGGEFDAIEILTDNEYDVDEFFGDEWRYPDMNESYFGLMRDFGEDNDAVVLMWEKVRTSDNTVDLIIIILICAAATLGTMGVIMLYRKLKTRRRVLQTK